MSPNAINSLWGQLDVEKNIGDLAVLSLRDKHVGSTGLYVCKF